MSRGLTTLKNEITKIMAEEMKGTVTPNAEPKEGQGDNEPNNPVGTDPKKTDAGGNEPFNPANLSDEDFNKIFEDKRLWTHDRFKNLSAKAKKSEEYEEQQRKAKEAKLKEEKKYEELIEGKEKENLSLKEQLQKTKVDTKVMVEAQKLGVVDLEAVLALINRSDIKVSDDGQVEGVSEALETLKSSKTYLFTGSNSSTVGSGSNPSGNNTGTVYKLSQLQDREFYKAHEEDINKAWQEGRIEDDMQG